MTSLGKSSLKLDAQSALNEILKFIRKTVRNSKASGIVLGLSGGVDSTLTAALCTQALGKDRVLGVLMPTSFTPEEDVKDALELAHTLGIRTTRVDIDPICKALTAALGVSENDPKCRISLANLRARIRMVVLYYYANSLNYLVAGTGDRSEALIGYFTKYGDGGADFFPIQHLYKTQVRELLEHIGIPERLAQKPSSPQLYPGHKLSDELPLNYDKLDCVLAGLFDLGLSPEKVSGTTEVPLDVVKEVLARHIRTEHKRGLPPKIEKHAPDRNLKTDSRRFQDNG